jgi:hypothetical protein
LSTNTWLDARNDVIAPAKVITIKPAGEYSNKRVSDSCYVG